VNLFNHNPRGQRSLEDPIGIFGNQLRALGHECVWRTANDQFLTADAGINIVVEGFTPSATQAIAEAHAKNSRFICLATEEPTIYGFNGGRDKEMVWRQKLFPAAAKYFEAIFHLVPGERVTRWYDQWAPAAYVELGHADTLVRRTVKKPDFDFGFFGSISRRRLKILRKLARYIGSEKAIRVVSDFPSQEARDEAMQSARVILQIRKYDEMGLVSSSRCNTALCNGRPVVAEPHDLSLSKPWDEIVWFSDSLDKFYSDALMVRTMWDGIYRSQFEKFKTKLSPQICVGEAIKKVNLDLTPPRLQMFFDGNKKTFPQAFAPRPENQIQTDTALVD
jgi:hypothetical protein